MPTPYSTFADVELHAGGPERLVQLADYDRDAVADASVVDDVIAEVDAWINTFVNKRWKTGFPGTTPPYITEISAKEVVYRLKRRRDTNTESDDNWHLECLEWLKMLAKGEVDPGVDPPPQKSSSVKGRYTKRSSSKKVSREKMQGYG